MSNDTTKVIEGFFIILVALPLFILWLRDYTRRARVMRHSKARAVGRASAYILGVSLVIIGIPNFWTDFEQRHTSIRPITSCVVDLVLIIFGLLLWAATRFRYGGGFWSIVGAFLVGGAFAGTVSIVEMHLQGWHYDPPIAFYIRNAAYWVIGSVLLFIGHRRHCKKKRVLPLKKLGV